MHIYLFFAGTLLSFVYQSFCQTSEVYRLVYHDIQEGHYDKCVRLLNGTHEVGCQSSAEGNVGVLFHINGTEDINRFMNILSKRDYVLLVEASLFNRSFVISMLGISNVQGILIYEIDDYDPTQWSPESACPNERTSLYNSSYGPHYAQCKNRWNSVGDGLTEISIPFPIFYIKNSTVQKNLIDCYNQYNSPERHQLCAVQMKSRMFGAVDSVTCLRRTIVQSTITQVGFCDVLQGKNVVTSLKRLKARDGSAADPAIFITATLDSRSFMTTSTSPGVDKATGFITLLGVAQALGKLNEDEKEKLLRNVVFVLFDGEAFDNIGSVRMVQDMIKGNFPVVDDISKIQPPPWTLDSLYRVIELGQLGKIEDTAWLHYDPLANNTQTTTDINDILSKLNTNLPSPALKIERQTSGPNIGLPPSSLHSILKQRQVPGVLLTDFDSQYTNMHYFSRYDDLRNLIGNYNSSDTDDNIRAQLQPLSQKLTNVSTSLARTIYELASGGTTTVPANVNVDDSLMTELLFCFLYKPNCDLFKETRDAFATNNLPDHFDRYVSASSALSPHGNISLYLLASFTGEKIIDATQCSNPDVQNQTVGYYHLKGPINGNSTCVLSSSFLTPAVFDTSDLSQSPGPWTESRWSITAFRLRVFLIQDQTSQGLTLFAGLLVLIASFVVVYFVREKADKLFRTEVSV